MIARLTRLRPGDALAWCRPAIDRPPADAGHHAISTDSLDCHHFCESRRYVGLRTNQQVCALVHGERPQQADLCTGAAAAEGTSIRSAPRVSAALPDRRSGGTGAPMVETAPVNDAASAPISVCFVCLGNICRSPTAEGVMASLVADAGLADRILVDSAGTGGWHVGDRADRRARSEASRRGIDLSSRARQFHPGDFYAFDLILAMDRQNLADLHDLAPEHDVRRKARLLRSFDPANAGSDADAPGIDLDVPDPYYGGDDGFAGVFDLIEAACRGLLDALVEGQVAASADEALTGSLDDPVDEVRADRR
jgi:protein-tyrosine phosphatase